MYAGVVERRIEATEGGYSLRNHRCYLNFVRDRLPKGVEPKLGPDATSVGWVYQYTLFPGYYCPDHPQGVWHDAEQNWVEGVLLRPPGESTDATTAATKNPKRYKTLVLLHSGPYGPDGRDGWQLQAVVPWLDERVEEPPADIEHLTHAPRDPR